MLPIGKYINLFTDFGFKRIFGQEAKFHLSEVAKFDKKEQAAYQQSLKHLCDLDNVVNTAKAQGEAIGLEKGEAIGVQLTLQIIRLYNEEKTIAKIATIVKKPIVFVQTVLQNAGLPH